MSAKPTRREMDSDSTWSRPRKTICQMKAPRPRPARIPPTYSRVGFVNGAGQFILSSSSQRTVLLSLLRVSACPRQGRESSHSCAIGQPLKSRCHWPVLLVVGGHRGRLCACPEVGFMHRAADSSAIARHKAYLKSHPWKTASILIGRLRPGSAHPVFRS